MPSLAVDQRKSFLVLVPRTSTPLEVEEMSAALTTTLSSQLGLSAVNLVDSLTWYREQFEISGNWDSWVWETVTGRDYASRQHHFDGFIVFGDRLGRAGANIADLALRNGRVVLAWKDDVLRAVLSITPLNEEDMTAGWGLITTSIGE
jgi:hypothetical protein